MSVQERRSDRRDRYQFVLNAVEYNTGGPQPPGLRRPVLKQLYARAGHDTEEFGDVLEAAIFNDDLLEWQADNATRYTRTIDADLLAVIEAEVASDDPDRDLIGHCNRLREGVA